MTPSQSGQNRPNRSSKPNKPHNRNQSNKNNQNQQRKRKNYSKSYSRNMHHQEYSHAEAEKFIGAPRQDYQAYSIEAINQYGVVKGIILSFKRILKCHPWGSSGYDPVK